MSEPWMGLHNPERHRLLSDGSAICDDSDDDVEQYWGCIEDCSETDPCKCCLAAEVESLREERDALKHDYDKVAAQVQAVRDACDAAFPINDIGTRVVTLSAILYALDGGDA